MEGGSLYSISEEYPSGITLVENSIKLIAVGIECTESCVVNESDPKTDIKSSISSS